MTALGRVSGLWRWFPTRPPVTLAGAGAGDGSAETGGGRQHAGSAGRSDDGDDAGGPAGSGTDTIVPDEQSAAVRVVARSADAFDLADFGDRNDQFKNAIFLPQPTLDELFPADHSNRGYVRASLPGGADSSVFYAVPFGPDHTPTTDPETGLHNAFLRANLQERIGGDPQHPTTEVELRPVAAAETWPLTLTRLSTHIETTESALCHVNGAVIDRLGVDSGDTVEVFNPDTGARMQIEIRETASLDEHHVALSTQVRKLLRVAIPQEADDPSVTTEVRLRKPVHDGGDTRSLWRRFSDWAFEHAVDYHEINLRVFPAPNTDENRNVARLNEETMRILGIEDGDKIVVSSFTEEKSVRCLLASEDSYLIQQDVSFREGDVSDRNILLPATEREAVDTLVHDVVRVRRDPAYVAGKQIVPSMFGILGVYVGGTQVLNIVAPSMDSGLLLGLLTALSAVTVWMVLWPERQKCR